MKRLGVNIDHIATVRNARGERHPDPFFAASQVVKMGADSVTIHLREDRRHINDADAKKICKLKNIFVNLEISMDDKIIKNALRIKPNYICIVPEKRKEVTTEGGLNLTKNRHFPYILYGGHAIDRSTDSEIRIDRLTGASSQRVKSKIDRAASSRPGSQQPAARLYSYKNSYSCRILQL